MVYPNRTGLTRLEVAVVIIVIVMLVALLLPAIRSGQDPRRSMCVNNQSELSKALLQFEMAHRHFPGYVNNFEEKWEGEKLVHARARNLNWVVMCLPYLGREDLWQQWRDSLGGGQVRLHQLICPSDSPPEQHPTSYVANCGRPSPDPNPPAACGVFHNHTVPPQARTLVSATSIPDGAENTLLVSENIQAGQWYDTAETQIGMVWQDDPGRCGRINSCLDHGSTAPSAEYARPSSYHSGGVVVSFCDGHVCFLREDIDYRVYQHLMTPDSAAAGVLGVLGESDY